MKKRVTVVFAAFEEPADVKMVLEEIEGANNQVILEEVFRRFNHAIPGVTGDLAEKHETRSLSVGDAILIEDVCFACQSTGWKKVY